jgi:hypothetical protein
MKTRLTLARAGCKETTVKRIARTLALTALVACVPSVALAAPGGGGGKPSGGGGGALSIPDGRYGGTTTATVTNPPTGTWVFATCYQGTAAVIFNRLELDAAGHAVLTLGPTDGYASGVGGADCQAEAKSWNLKRQKWISVATTTFHVAD